MHGLLILIVVLVLIILIIWIVVRLKQNRSYPLIIYGHPKRRHKRRPVRYISTAADNTSTDMGTITSDLSPDAKANLGSQLIQSHNTWVNTFKGAKIDTTSHALQTAENPLWGKYQYVYGGRKPVIKYNPTSDQVTNDVTNSEINEYNKAYTDSGYTN